eukprot:gene1458-2805_t
MASMRKYLRHIRPFSFSTAATVTTAPKEVPIPVPVPVPVFSSARDTVAGSITGTNRNIGEEMKLPSTRLGSNNINNDNNNNNENINNNMYLTSYRQKKTQKDDIDDNNIEDYDNDYFIECNGSVAIKTTTTSGSSPSLYVPPLKPYSNSNHHRDRNDPSIKDLVACHNPFATATATDVDASSSSLFTSHHPHNTGTATTSSSSRSLLIASSPSLVAAKAKGNTADVSAARRTEDLRQRMTLAWAQSQSQTQTQTRHGTAATRTRTGDNDDNDNNDNNDFEPSTVGQYSLSSGYPIPLLPLSSSSLSISTVPFPSYKSILESFKLYERRVREMSAGTGTGRRGHGYSQVSAEDLLLPMVLTKTTAETMSETKAGMSTDSFEAPSKTDGAARMGEGSRAIQGLGLGCDLRATLQCIKPHDLISITSDSHDRLGLRLPGAEHVLGAVRVDAQTGDFFLGGGDGTTDHLDLDRGWMKPQSGGVSGSGAGNQSSSDFTGLTFSDDTVGGGGGGGYAYYNNSSNNNNDDDPKGSTGYEVEAEAGMWTWTGNRPVAAVQGSDRGDGGGGGGGEEEEEYTSPSIFASSVVVDVDVDDIDDTFLVPEDAAAATSGNVTSVLSKRKRASVTSVLDLTHTPLPAPHRTSLRPGYANVPLLAIPVVQTLVRSHLQTPPNRTVLRLDAIIPEDRVRNTYPDVDVCTAMDWYSRRVFVATVFLADGYNRQAYTQLSESAGHTGGHRPGFAMTLKSCADECQPQSQSQPQSHSLSVRNAIELSFTAARIPL